MWLIISSALILCFTACPVVSHAAVYATATRNRLNNRNEQPLDTAAEKYSMQENITCKRRNNKSGYRINGKDLFSGIYSRDRTAGNERNMMKTTH